MIMIRCFRTLDHYTVTVAVLDDRHPGEPKGVERVQSIAYATFADPPDGGAEDLSTMLLGAIECGQAWVDKHSGGLWADLF